MIYIGDKKIKRCYLGDEKIGKVYLGDKPLYQHVSRLPAGYKELEYISNPNMSYMLLPFTVSTFSSLRFEVSLRRSGDEIGTIVGAYSLYTTNTGGTTAREQSFGIKSSGVVSVGYTSVYQAASNELLSIIYDGPSKTCSVNENEPVPISIGNSLYTSAKPALFALIARKYGKTTGSSYSNILNCHFYHMKIYSNSVLICEYYPCVNPDGEVGIYDVVGNGFLQNVNASRPFVAGPAV